MRKIILKSMKEEGEEKYNWKMSKEVSRKDQFEVEKKKKKKKKQRSKREKNRRRRREKEGGA